MNSTDSSEVTAPTTPQQDTYLWYKDAIIYQLHVKAFSDSNGDGIGDFPGLIRKLDYLQELGVTALWLLPFYPSPMKDDGYDIADYRNVAEGYGTIGDFKQFVKEAHRRGLKVITELVVNHTSDQHPWFQSARRAPKGSFKHNFYVWSDTENKYTQTRIIFTDTETSNWAWDPIAKSYYWHRFFSHQPDLNFENPGVMRALLGAMRFWLDMGVDGLRLDAIPYLCEREGTNNENLPETHDVIKQMRGVIDKHYKNRMLLAEANQWPEDVRDYFGEENECHMAFHFPLMPRMYMAIAQEDRHPIVEILHQTPDLPESCQWAIFLRNHDELTLEMVTNKERDYMYQMYAADKRARINLGIRRRLAPLLENDSERIKLMNTLLLSMPGSPIIYYGDEIGMGDNIYLGDRNGVRTPMQWNPDRNGGFSTADPQKLYLPPIMDPIYGYSAVNVEAQSRDPSSLLNWMRRILAVRKNYIAFGRGSISFLRPGNRKILAFVREYESELILVVVNLARSAQPVELDLSKFKGKVPVELMGKTAFPPIGDLPYLFTLSGYGFYWFKLTEAHEAPSWHEERLPREELPVLVFFDGWKSLFRERVVPWRSSIAQKTLVQFEKEIVPQYVANQLWYRFKDKPQVNATLVEHVVWNHDKGTWLLGLYKLEMGDSFVAYFLPLSLSWEDSGEEYMRNISASALAKVRQQARIGVIYDSFADPVFCLTLLQSIKNNIELDTTHGKIRFWSTDAFDGRYDEAITNGSVKPAPKQDSNTTLAINQQLFLKGYRELKAGNSPDIDVGLFLTNIAKFPNIAPILGGITYTHNDGKYTTLALLEGYIANQGDGRTYTLDYLDRFFNRYRSEVATSNSPAELHGGFLILVNTLGKRTAELHKALASNAEDPAFIPEPFTQNDFEELTNNIENLLKETFVLLKEFNKEETGNIELQAFLQSENEMMARVKNFSLNTAVRSEAHKIRCHGDYRLNHLLLAQNDFVIINFEEDQTSSSHQKKFLPLKDIAALLISFHEALEITLQRFSEENLDINTVLLTLGNEWLKEVYEAFLKSYAKEIEGSQIYASFQELYPLLRLYFLKRSFYELKKTLINNPKDYVKAIRIAQKANLITNNESFIF